VFAFLLHLWSISVIIRTYANFAEMTDSVLLPLTCTEMLAYLIKGSRVVTWMCLLAFFFILMLTSPPYFSPRRPGFAPRSVQWDLWWQSGTGTGFSQSSSVFPVSIIPQRLHIHSCIIRGRAMGPLAAAVPLRHSLTTPHKSCINVQDLQTDSWRYNSYIFCRGIVTT
jgi:hypothetical protein